MDTNKLNTLRKSSPIVVTATGGSGTRVVAEILERLGCYMGGNLNFAKDNMDLAYILTGNIPELASGFPFKAGHKDFEDRLDLFETCFFHDPLSAKDIYKLFKIGLGFLKKDKRWAVQTRPASDRLDNTLRIFRLKGAIPPVREPSMWGFKDPDAMYLFWLLKKRYVDFKIIHLVRDGRDMALSTQVKPLMYYGPLFGIPPHFTPENAFVHWAKANTWIKETCEKHLPPENSLFIQFESLCQTPQIEIDKIAEFIGIDCVDDTGVYSIPRQIQSIGRWEKSPELFDDLDTSALKAFGYE